MLFRAVCAFRSAPEHYALDQANLVQAINMLEDFIIDFPESNNMPEARTHLLEARTRLAQKNYKNAKVYMFMGAYGAAVVYFQIVIDDYTDTEYAPRALFGLGEALYKKKLFNEARDKFENFITVYADHELRLKAEVMAVKAAFSDGEHAFKLAQFDKARQSFEDFIERYPQSGKKDKVDDYLKKIKAISPDSTKVENAGSEIGRTVGDPWRNI
jgi:outer membrane protein assembly factor BamD (BamD/ComL family)